MVADDGNDWIREIDRRKDLRADRRVELHLLELGGRQLAGLVQDVLGYRDLACVVEQRRGLDGLERRLVGDADLAGQAHGGHLQPADVAVRDLVLGVDGGCERLDGREIEPVERRDMSLGVLGPAERRLQGEVEHDEDGRDQQECRQRPEVHLTQRDDEQERHAGAGGIAGPEPEKVLPPDAERGAPRIERDRRCDESAVDQEVTRGEDREWNQQSVRRRLRGGHGRDTRLNGTLARVFVNVYV